MRYPAPDSEGHEAATDIFVHALLPYHFLNTLHSIEQLLLLAVCYHVLRVLAILAVLFAARRGFSTFRLAPGKDRGKIVEIVEQIM
jgi:hypothetical protein